MSDKPIGPLDELFIAGWAARLAELSSAWPDLVEWRAKLRTLCAEVEDRTRRVIAATPTAWEVRDPEGRSVDGDFDTLLFGDEQAARDRATRDMCDHVACPNGPSCKDPMACRAFEVVPLCEVTRCGRW